MKKTVLPIAGALVAAAFLAQPPTGWATVPMQSDARSLGYPAEDCDYCHSFDLSRMRERGAQLGTSTTNCYNCHGKHLPLSGLDLFSDRGRFLMDEKERRKTKKVDVKWLADYVEEDEEEPANPPGE